MVVSLATIRDSNNRLKEAEEGLVALFLGATSGIGLASLKQFVEHATKPRVYIVARSGTPTINLFKTLIAINSTGTYEFIEKNVSLLKETKEVVEFVKAREAKLDILFMSVGFFSFDGRQDTSEGLDASMTTRYYSRILAAKMLLPLLSASSSPRVVSILAAGQEGKIDEKDLSLSKPNAFSVGAGNNHVGTMMTLALEHLAKENPHITFVHTFPGVVATPFLGKASSGFLGVVFRWIVVPLLSLLVMSPAEAGERGLFYATSARYSTDAGIVPVSEGLTVSKKSEGGVFLVDGKGEYADNETVLADFRKRGVDKAVWEHTVDIFAATL